MLSQKVSRSPKIGAFSRGWRGKEILGRICELPRLNYINITIWSITLQQLPKELFHNENVKTLGFVNVQLQGGAIAEGSASPKHIDKVIIRGSNLVRFPELFLALESLKTLEITNCDLREMVAKCVPEEPEEPPPI